MQLALRWAAWGWPPSVGSLALAVPHPAFVSTHHAVKVYVGLPTTGSAEPEKK